MDLHGRARNLTNVTDDDDEKVKGEKEETIRNLEKEFDAWAHNLVVWILTEMTEYQAAFLDLSGIAMNDAMLGTYPREHILTRLEKQMENLSAIALKL